MEPERGEDKRKDGSTWSERTAANCIWHYRRPHAGRRTGECGEQP